MRQAVAEFLERPIVINGIITVIVFNAILLGLETSDPVMAAAGGLIKALDMLCLIIFIVEIAAKLFAHRLQFFRNGWNVFDFLVVGIALIPGAQGLSVLRALRILRVLRVISAAPSLRRVVEGFITALPGMGSVFLLMGMMFYIGAVMATQLFGDAFPEWFGTLGKSGYSLFQIMTLESWSMGIVRPVMEVFPYACSAMMRATRNAPVQPRPHFRVTIWCRAKSYAKTGSRRFGRRGKPKSKLLLMLQRLLNRLQSLHHLIPVLIGCGGLFL